MQYHCNNRTSSLCFWRNWDLRIPSTKISLWHNSCTYMMMASDKPKHVTQILYCLSTNVPVKYRRLCSFITFPFSGFCRQSVRYCVNQTLNLPLDRPRILLLLTSVFRSSMHFVTSQRVTYCMHVKVCAYKTAITARQLASVYKSTNLTNAIHVRHYHVRWTNTR
jgi:hypothetical protein